MMAAEKITSETEVSELELACVLGIGGRHVRKLCEDGVIEHSSRGRYHLADSAQKYIAMIKAGGVADASKLETARKSAEVALKTAKSRVAKMEADELEGKMHRSEDVAAMTEELVFTIRGALEAFPGRVAVDAAAAESPAEVADIIRREVHAVMRELATFQYDPKKYEERVRRRKSWDAEADDEEEE